MTDMTATREVVQGALRRELFGPAEGDAPAGTPLNLTASVKFPSWEAVQGPYHEEGTGQEVLSETEPTGRYGVGVLHPARQVPDATVEVPGIETERLENEPTPEAATAAASDEGDVSEDGDDLDLSLANAWEPSTMGLSLSLQAPEGSSLRVVGTCARYEKVNIAVGDKAPTWWVRRPVTFSAAFRAEDLAGKGRRILSPRVGDLDVEGIDAASLEIRAFSRLVHGDRLVTVTVTNRREGRGSDACLFQVGFEVTTANGAAILPYRERAIGRQLDDEERSIALLYRRHQTFAIGHGCAASWDEEPGATVSRVQAVALPTYETPSVTPDIEARDGSLLKIDMRVLADASRSAEAEAQVGELLASYEEWITQKRAEGSRLNTEEHRDTAEAHLEACVTVLERMREGWALVRQNERVGKAFRLANEAMLLQQARSGADLRPTELDAQGLVRVAGTQPSGDVPPTRGFWRPFQIAFFLATLESAANGGSDDRELVELIFFPTGGGKTEAYLGLAAFSMLLRRLRATSARAEAEGAGTDVLMRYTLRLLTAQQFLRAAALVCALERLRDRDDELGAPFSIGIWLGGDTTPNTHSQALKVWDALAADPAGAPNKFLLLRCPWCGAQMGPTDEQQRFMRGRRGKAPKVIPGYVRGRDRVRLCCPDRSCDFKDGLPLYVVDDDIYDHRPSLIIGTVDKFAMLPWRPRARAIFGIDDDGNRDIAPPNLIIQDEFHLISGPLGSMVGLYEGVIEDLCTDKRHDGHVRPKIVASTATIRRYEDQTRAVYGRERVELFPPQGITADDAFFAVWARDRATRKLLPGRRYVGVHAPALKSMQSVQVRVGAALLQAPLNLATPQEQDPWWTNLWFFNSLRELGNTLSLMQSDIPDYIVGMMRRDRLGEARYPGTPLELTSRRRDDEIPKAIERLQTKRADEGAVSVCLSSSIIEVGVDIDRLSLMTIVGQPKTTAQYIQVSGRVGRRWTERPGLVVTIYGSAKPRDRSHYERFRSYHDRLYAQVEPTSVTPFAKPVLQRALRAAVVAHVRMYAPIDLPVWPFPAERFKAARQLLLDRAQKVDDVELDAARQVLDSAEREWSRWEKAEWDGNPMFGSWLDGLMRFPGSAEPPTPSWEIPSSMRNVDAECRATITTAYHEAAAQEETADE